jgi:hypothetical protein
MKVRLPYIAARRLRLLGIGLCLLMLISALVLGAYSVRNWISMIEAMLRSQVESPSTFVGLEALVSSALPKGLSESVRGAKAPQELNDLLFDIESQLSTSIRSRHRTRPCARSTLFDILPDDHNSHSPHNSNSPIDVYVTEAESRKDKKPNPTFLYVPAGLIRIPAKVDPITALECFDPLLRTDVERTRRVSESLRRLTTFTLTDKNSNPNNLYIVQAFIITVRGVIRITENESVVKSPRKYYEGQFEPNTFFARTGYFKATVSNVKQKPIEKGKAVDVNSYFTVSQSYLDLGGNGVVTTICRSLSIESSRDSVLCMDVSAVATDKTLQMLETQKALYNLGATKFEGECRIKDNNDQLSADCDQSFGQYRKLLEDDINQQPSKLATIFGQLKLVQAGPDQFLFTIPVKSSEAMNSHRQQKLLLWKVAIVGLNFKGFLGPSLSGVLIIGAALGAFILYKQLQLDRFMRDVDGFHGRIVNGDMVNALVRLQEVANEIDPNKITIHSIPDDFDLAIQRAHANLIGAAMLLEGAIDNARMMELDLENTYGRKKKNIGNGDRRRRALRRDPQMTIAVNASRCNWQLSLSSALPRLESVYEIVHEALLNIKKHADAAKAIVEIDCSYEALQVKITDNGIGLQTEGSPTAHFGLDIMERRAREIGGKFEFNSTPKVGTTVSFSVPFKDMRDSE